MTRPRLRVVALWLLAIALITPLAVVASRATSPRSTGDVTAVPEMHPLATLSAGSGAALSPDVPVSTADAPEPRGPIQTPEDDRTCVLQAPVTEAELLTVLYDGHVAWFGTPPPPHRLACAFAHCALEHGRGKRLFGNNLGHVTTAGNWTGKSCLHSWTERAGTRPDRWTVVRLRFRMHDTLEDGAIDYWKLMDTQYRTALDACDAGNAEAAGRILGEQGYYTSDVDSYATAMKGLFVTARKRIVSESGKALRP